MPDSHLNDWVREAISYIPSDDRDTWVTVGMGLSDGLGSEGWDIWDSWSRTSKKYNERDAKAVWNSFKKSGVSLGTVWALAQENGWSGEGYAISAVKAQSAPRKDPDENPYVLEQVMEMLEQATYQIHPYLESKGYPAERGLVLDGKLMIPMRDYRTQELRAVQVIDELGKKKFLPWGCRAGGSSFTIGRKGRVWWVEGYATGLAVQRSLDALHQRGSYQVVVTFSAGNLAKLAKREGTGIVIADHDAWVCRHCGSRSPVSDVRCRCGSYNWLEPAGEKAARASGRPFWVPPIVGWDANDFVVHRGQDALTEELRGMLTFQTR